MNKIKSFENIFPFYPLPCWKKLGGKKNIKICWKKLGGGKNKKICSRGKK